MARRDAWLHAVGFAILSVVLVGSLWTISYLPTGDGPESILAVHMENHYGDPGTIYREVFAPAPQFAGRGFTVLFEPLEEWLGWQRGLQVALSIMVLLHAWGMVALARAVDPRRVPLAFLGFPLALSWTLYMGFFAFVVASGVGLFVLAVALADRPPGAARRGLVAALLLVQASLHLFPAILTGIVIAATRTARAPRGRRLVELAKVTLAGAPAAALVVAAFLVARRSATTATFSHDFGFVSLAESLAVWPRTLAPGPRVRALVVTASVALSGLYGASRVARRGTAAGDRAFVVLGGLFLATSVLGPRDLPGWQCFSQRFVSLAMVLLVLALPLERVTSARVSRGLAALSFAAALAWVALSYPFHRRLEAACADAIAGLSAKVERHGLWLPVTLEPAGAPLTAPGDAEVPLLAPLRHIGALYATVEGGLTPYTFAGSIATWPFALRQDAPHPPPVPPQERFMTLLARPELQTDLAFRHQQESELATFGLPYEGVLLTGARPDDLALWHRHGYVPDWEQGSVMIAHFVPCPIELTIPRDADDPRLDIGIGRTVILRDVRPAPAPSPEADGLRHLAVDRGPCGRVWAKPHWDAPAADGKVDVSFCSNAAANGELHALVTRTSGRFTCAGRGATVRP